MDQNIPGARMSLGQDAEKTGQMPVVELTIKNNITVHAQNWLQFKGQESANAFNVLFWQQNPDWRRTKPKTLFAGTFDTFVKNDSVFQYNVLFLGY